MREKQDNSLLISSCKEEAGPSTNQPGQFALSQQDMVTIRNQINLSQIHIDVFKLFDINWKYDPTVSVQKLYTYYINNEQKYS